MVKLRKLYSEEAADIGVLTMAHDILRDAISKLTALPDLTSEVSTDLDMTPGRVAIDLAEYLEDFLDGIRRIKDQPVQDADSLEDDIRCGEMDFEYNPRLEESCPERWRRVS